jgi:hypothetical protein
VKSFGNAWDAGTGNGQVAMELAKHFEQVLATDISASQLAQAPAAANISYSVAPAEASGIDGKSIDLITVAQAVHWFDLPSFTEEVRRVSSDRALLAVWGYDILRVSENVDALIDYLHSDVLEGYWDPHRFLIDDRYSTITFPFPAQPSRTFEMYHNRGPAAHVGYLRSWSAVQIYKQQHGIDPVLEIEQRLYDAMDGETMVCRTPVFLKLWQVGSGY